MDGDPIISLENIAARLGSRVLLRNTTWRIRPGENWGLLGPNGSGKTTLARTLAGRVPVVQGRVTRRVVAGGIAYVSPEQHRELLAREERVLESRHYSGDIHAVTTVGDVIRRSASAADPCPPQRRLHRVAERLGIDTLLGKDIQSISSGEMRRTLIARALMENPGLLILDEPFEGLDRAARDELVRVIERLMAEHVQLVLATHRREEILPGITHLILLHEGSVRISGRWENVLCAVPDAAAANRAKALPALPPPPAATAAGPADGAPPRELVRMRAVTVAYKGVRVLEDVSWTMRSGENWMIVGPNGAGKSTLLKLIFADHPQAYANEIHLFGRRVGSGDSIWETRRRIGFVSPHLQARYRRGLSVAEVICSGFFDSVGLYRTCSPQQQETARRWAQTLGIDAWSGLDFGRLSYGQRQLVLLARAMVKSPRLLVLDEPCDGLDADRRRDLLGLLERIGSRGATNLIYVTHRAEDRLSCTTHTLMLERGRVTARSGGSGEAPRGSR